MEIPAIPRDKSSQRLRDDVVGALEDLKGHDIVALDVSSATDITDYMVIASGTSNRHVKALVDQVMESSRAHGHTVLGVEGLGSNEWVLLDLGDVVVHVMQKDTRDFYDLERLWSTIGDRETSIA
jgi:ribosome-associated protein